jgi:hypothetical protein
MSKLKLAISLFVLLISMPATATTTVLNFTIDPSNYSCNGSSNISSCQIYSSAFAGNISFSPVTLFNGDILDVNLTFAPSLNGDWMVGYDLLPLGANNAVAGGFDHILESNSRFSLGPSGGTAFVTLVGPIPYSVTIDDLFFYGSPAPEPATWLLMLFGFVMLYLLIVTRGAFRGRYASCSRLNVLGFRVGRMLFR